MYLHLQSLSQCPGVSSREKPRSDMGFLEQLYLHMPRVQVPHHTDTCPTMQRVRTPTRREAHTVARP